MFLNIVILLSSLFAVMKGSSISTTYAVRLSQCFHISKYIIGLLVVAVISILPETFISINAAFTDVPSLALGVLFGSNVTDLTLVFAIITFLAHRDLKVESKILKHHTLYPFILILPLILGLDGNFTRIEGVALIFVGLVFYYLSFKDGKKGGTVTKPSHSLWKSFFMLVLGMLILIIGSHFVVGSASALALQIGVSPTLIGMLVIGLGTTMPELFFSLKSIRLHDDSLAIGDILGTVLADATIVIGILALLNPFTFSKAIIYVAGIFMVASAFILFSFLRSGKVLTRKEAFALFILWITFILVELIVNT